jgi:hypothetical protein
MNLKIFYHVVDLPFFTFLVHEQFTEMRYSGLLDIAEVYVCCNYNEANYRSLQNEYKNYTNIHWIFQQNVSHDFEIPTLNFMKDMADNSEEEFFALYLHLKGIMHLGGPLQVPTTHWRWLMNYFNITKWKDCVAKLEEGYDAVGCLINPDVPPKHFSGNFHWARSSFIKKCNKFLLPHTIGFAPQIPHGKHYRFDAEAWYGYNNANMYSLYNVWQDYYTQECPPYLYRE